MPSEDPHSVFGEPHLGGPGPNVDPSEAKARRVVDRRSHGGQPSLDDGQGVYDEPNIFPNRTVEVIEQDWSCGTCGYNLRGLTVGHPCPECGAIELYRPAPANAPSYRTSLLARIARTHRSTGWWVAVIAAILGGPFAVVGVFMEQFQGGLFVGALLVTVLFGPAIEEVMKIAVAAIVIETRCHWFQRVEQIQLATIGAAAMFAAIENILYLTVYIPNPSAEIVAWRWTVCVALHVGCTAIATRGLVNVWRRAMTEQRPPRIGDGQRMLITAIIVHGVYNATVTGFEWLFPNGFW